MAEKDLHFSAKAEEELKVFTAAVQDIMNRAVTVLDVYKRQISYGLSDAADPAAGWNQFLHVSTAGIPD